MPIQWYQVRKRSQGALGDFFALSDLNLRFSSDAYKKYFKEMPYLSVGYDETENSVFIKPNEKEGFKVLRNHGVGLPYIRWIRFTESFRIHFDRTCSILIKNGPQKDVFMLDLKGCSKTSAS